MAVQSVPITSKVAAMLAAGQCPIDQVQQRVYHAVAVCKMLAASAESVSTYEKDLMGALLGLADTLGDIQLELDPTPFRAAVLASGITEVANA